MQLPAISHGCFAILAVLMDGHAKTRSEVATLTGFDAESANGKDYVQLRICIRILHRDGFLRKFVAPVDAKKGIRGMGSGSRTVLVITPEGEIAFKECADFYLHYIREYSR